MFNKIKKNNQKGAVAILIAVVMMVTILFIAITVSSIIAKTQQSSNRLSDSIKAYQAADSGLEYSLKLFSDFMAIDPLVKVMTLEDFLEYSDELDDNYIEGDDDYNKRQFCSGDSTEWIIISSGPPDPIEVEFCLEPKVDVLENIFVMQAVGKSGLTKRAVGIRLPVPEAVACYVREGCPSEGGSDASGICQLNRSLEGDPGEVATYDSDYDYNTYPNPYPEDEICCDSLNACDKINGGIDYGSCSSGDLFCANKQAVFLIDEAWGIADTNQVSINGGPSDDDFVTDSEHAIFVFTEGDARHNGIYDDSPLGGLYRLEPNDGGAISCNAIKIAKDFVKIDGLQITAQTLAGCTGIFVKALGYEGVEIANNIIRGQNNVQGKGISIKNGSLDTKVWNNIIYDFNGALGQGIHAWGNNNIVYNNTIYNAGTGVMTVNVQTRLINNIVSQCSTPFAGNFSWGSYNTWDIGGAAEEPAGVGGGNIDATPVVQPLPPIPPIPPNPNTIDFQDKDNDNFLLESLPLATAAQDRGTNLGLEFDTDIQGDPRPLAAWWDIGADEN